jgi:hypothetical protein
VRATSVLLLCLGALLVPNALAFEHFERFLNVQEPIDGWTYWVWEDVALCGVAALLAITAALPARRRRLTRVALIVDAVLCVAAITWLVEHAPGAPGARTDPAWANGLYSPGSGTMAVVAALAVALAGVVCGWVAVARGRRSTPAPARDPRRLPVLP